METRWSVRSSPLSGGHWTRKQLYIYTLIQPSSLLLVVTRYIVQILLCFHLHVSVHGWGVMRVMTLSSGGDSGRVMESVYLILGQTQRAGPGLPHWHVGEGLRELLLWRWSLAIAGPKFKSGLKRCPMSPSIQWLTDLRKALWDLLGCAEELREGFLDLDDRSDRTVEIGVGNWILVLWFLALFFSYSLTLSSRMMPASSIESFFLSSFFFLSSLFLALSYSLISCLLFFSILEVGRNSSSALQVISRFISQNKQILCLPLHLISSSQYFFICWGLSVITSHSMATCLWRRKYQGMFLQNKGIYTWIHFVFSNGVGQIPPSTL